MDEREMFELDRQLKAAQIANMLPNCEPTLFATCIGCGCDADHACGTPEAPCFWVAVDETGEFGICSACAVKPLDELMKAKVTLG